jgi:hypothetical protein
MALTRKPSWLVQLQKELPTYRTLGAEFHHQEPWSWQPSGKKRVLEHLRYGDTLAQAAEATGWSRRTIYTWAREDPEFAKAIKIARRQGRKARKFGGAKHKWADPELVIDVPSSPTAVVRVARGVIASELSVTTRVWFRPRHDSKLIPTRKGVVMTSEVARQVAEAILRAVETTAMPEATLER